MKFKEMILNKLIIAITCTTYNVYIYLFVKNRNKTVLFIACPGLSIFFQVSQYFTLFTGGTLYSN
jgi:hypothetical protein